MIRSFGNCIPATANRVRSVSVMGRVLFVLGLGLLTQGSGCATTSNPYGETGGYISISSPRVYTRGRMVNERLEHEQWLRKQLEEADTKKFGYQGLSDVSSVSALMVGASVQADPIATGLYRELGEAAIGSTQRQTRIDALNDEIEYLNALRQLEDARAALLEEGGTSSGRAIPSLPQALRKNAEVDAGGGNGAEDGGGSSGGDDPSASELSLKMPFEGKLFADQTPLIKNMLALSSGHGAPAQTLATPSPIDEFRDKKAYREEIKREIASTILDDSHDLNGNTLYQLDFDLSVLPNHDVGEWAVVKVIVENPFQKGAGGKSMCDADYLELWAQELVVNLNAEARAVADEWWDQRLPARQRWEYKATIERIIKALDDHQDNDAEMEGPIGEFSSNRDDLGKLLDFEVKNSEQALLAQKVIGFRLTEIANRSLFWILKGALNEEIETKETIKSEEVIKTKEAINEWNENNELPFRFFTLANTAEIHQSTSEDQTIDAEARARRTTRERARESITVGRRVGPYYEILCKEIQTSAQISTYGVTPRESVERLSNVLSAQNARNLTFGLELLAGEVGAKAAVQHLKSQTALFHAIQRQPLVVGFSGCGTGSTRRGHSSCFGWVVGPRFTPRVKSKKDEELRFRHSMANHPVSATVSLPAGLSEVQLEVETYWLDEEGKRQPSEQFDPKYDVHLSDDIRKLTEILIPRLRPRRPIAEITAIENLRAGERTNLILRGSNMWRSPEVAIGDQLADKIRILPDMQGLIATFDPLKIPSTCASTTEECAEEVYAYTSEGRSFAGWVTIIPPKKKPDTRLAVDAVSPRLIGTSRLTLRSSTKLPASYDDLYPAIRLAGSGEDFARLEPITPIDGSNDLEGEVSKELLKVAFSSHYRNVMLLDSAIITIPRPDAPKKIVPAREKVVFFETLALASPTLTTTTANTLPATAKIALPKHVAVAYPGYNSATFKATASIKGKPNINLIAVPKRAAPGLDVVIAPKTPDDAAAFQEARAIDLQIAIEVSGGHPALPKLSGSIAVPKTAAP